MGTLTPETEAGRRGDAVVVELDHSPNRPRGGSGPDVATSASRRAVCRGAKWPPRHRRNRWDKNGRQGAARAKCSADRRVWEQRKGSAAAFSSHPTLNRHTRQGPGVARQDARPQARRLSAGATHGTFSVQSHAAAVRRGRTIRRSSGKNSALTRRRSRASPPACRLATATRSAWAGRRSECRRKNSRSRRFMRLRTTALPTLRETAMPVRVNSPALSRGSTKRRKCSVW